MAQSTTGEQQLIPVSLQLVAGATLIAGPSYELQALEMQPAGKILGDLSQITSSLEATIEEMKKYHETIVSENALGRAKRRLSIKIGKEPPLLKSLRQLLELVEQVAGRSTNELNHSDIDTERTLAACQQLGRPLEEFAARLRTLAHNGHLKIMKKEIREFIDEFRRQLGTLMHTLETRIDYAFNQWRGVREDLKEVLGLPELKTETERRKSQSA